MSIPVNVVYGDDQTFDHLSFGVPNVGTLNYLTERFHQASGALAQMGQGIFQAATNLYQKYASDDAVRLAQAALRKVQNIWQPDIVYSMCDIGQFQQAQMTMIRWIMANPTVRQMYHRNEIDGYSDQYVDAQPDVLGEEHYDYRRAMDGYVVINDHAGEDEPEWHADSYFEDLHPDDGDLSLEDQTFIQESWNNICALIAQGQEDPTSRFNSRLD